MQYSRPYVIAECCGNHCGSIDTARKMIKVAAECGANAVKFQKRNPKELLTKEQYNSPHPNPENSFGDTYGLHREFLEFPISVHRFLDEECRNNGVEYSTSVWDMTSAEEVVEEINPKFIKIPSASNNDIKMLRYLKEKYQGDVHISVGMTTKKEEEDIAELFGDQCSRLTIYCCTSGYPIPMENVYLLELNRINEFWKKSRKANIGFSGHHLGIAVDVAAFALGAQYIERHFTLDRSWKGTDQKASLDGAELKALCSNLVDVYKALNYKPNGMIAIENEQRKKLKKFT